MEKRSCWRLFFSPSWEIWLMPVGWFSLVSWQSNRIKPEVVVAAVAALLPCYKNSESGHYVGQGFFHLCSLPADLKNTSRAQGIFKMRPLWLLCITPSILYHPSVEWDGQNIFPPLHLELYFRRWRFRSLPRQKLRPPPNLFQHYLHTLIFVLSKSAAAAAVSGLSFLVWQLRLFRKMLWGPWDSY